MNNTVPFHAKATLLAASTLTVMAGATIAPALPAMSDHFQGVPHAGLLVRLVLTIPALAVALLGVPVGAAVDRWGRCRVLAGATSLYALAGVSGAFFDNIHVILVGRFLLGVSVAGVMTATTALIADLFSGPRRAGFLGLQAAFMAVGGFVFLPVGGMLAEVGWRVPFFVYLAALPLLPGIMLALPDPYCRRSDRRDGGFRSLPWKILGPLYAAALSSMVVFYLVPVQMPFHIREILGGGPSQIGAALAAMTLASGVTSISYRRIERRLGHRKILFLGFAMLGAGLGLIGLSQRYAGIVIGLSATGFGLGMMIPNFNHWVSVVAPGAARGRALGGLTTFIFLGQFLSPILAYRVVEELGLGSTWYVAGAVTVALGIGLWLSTSDEALPETAGP